MPTTQHLVELMRNALAQHGYWAIAVALLLENAGVPVPGETILLLASFLAYSRHELQLPWIILVATLAATVAGRRALALLAWPVPAGCIEWAAVAPART